MARRTSGTTRKGARRHAHARPQAIAPKRRLPVLAIVGVAIAIAAGLIAVQQLTAGSGKPDISNLAGLDQVRTQFAGIPENGDAIGRASAKVTITEFGDLRCPVCREFSASVTPQLIDRFVRAGTARFRFRLWPILGDNSVVAARAAYAAQQQGKLWPYLTTVYLNQGDEQVDWFDDAFARAVAQAQGLDLARFDRDRASPAADATIAANDTAARALAMTGTPSLTVSGPGGAKTFTKTVPTLAQLVQAVAGVSA